MYFALADGKMGLIDSRDISDFAAHVLTSAGHEGQTYTLTGPASLSMHQIAAAIGNAVGKDSDLRAGCRRGGPAVDGAGWALTSGGELECGSIIAYGANWGDLVTDDFQRVTGKAPRNISQFARDFAGALGSNSRMQRASSIPTSRLVTTKGASIALDA